jgi:hypothetical protein
VVVAAEDVEKMVGRGRTLDVHRVRFGVPLFLTRCPTCGRRGSRVEPLRGNISPDPWVDPHATALPCCSALLPSVVAASFF